MTGPGIDIATAKQNRDPATRLQIPILNDANVDVGTLICLDQGLAGDDTIVASLTEWRNANRESFLTQFDATRARTRAWLQNVVVAGTTGRILFLIADADGRIVGNAGLCNIGAGRAELDNILRAERSRVARIAFYALAALTRWVFDVLRAETADLHVFSNNSRAVSLYEGLGFATTNVYRLSRLADANGIRYLVSSDDGEPVDFGYQKMEVGREAFFRRHIWMPPAR